MKYLLLLVLYSTINFNCAMILPQSVEEHYWRDYHGLVPTDALPGGKTVNGEITYIGKMSIPAEYNMEISQIHTFPVTITNGNRTAVGAYHGRVVTSNDHSQVKVLCSQYQETFEWHPHDQELIKTGCHFVIAGFEDSVSMLVGRTEYKNETIVGKLYSEGNRHYIGLIIPYENGVLLPQDYDILMYC